MPTPAGFGQEKQELEAVLASGIFHRAPNLAQLLTYVCGKHFEGAAEQIKEYNIAVDALGRPADFDQKRDSIVRVEAHKLRKRLREYYELEGASHALHIDIPPGQYAPRFLPKGAHALDGEPRNASSLDREPKRTAAFDVATAGSNGLMLAASAANTGMASKHSAVSQQSGGMMIPAPGFLRSRPTRNGLIGLFLLVSCAGALALWTPARKASRSISTTPIAAPAVTGAREIRILAGRAGSDYTDRLGRVWQSDRYVQGGHGFEFRDHPISGTREPGIYQSRREGTFTYEIPLPPEVYELRLHFAETLYGENNVAGGGEASRVFKVSINGREALHEFDIISEVGPSAADIRAFKDVSPASDGMVHLSFEPLSNPPLLSAIEITPGTPGRLRPIRMISLDRTYTDKQGRVWEPDRYSRSGQLVQRTAPVDGVEDPELYRGERFGNLKYLIPVPPGRYAVAFYFAETWFGPEMSAGGGAGSRVFDIFGNGVALRRNFDIFKEAHGTNRGMTWTTHGLEPDSQGKLALSLMPIRNYACVNAIEVLDESK
jgi:hypothetical protein